MTARSGLFVAPVPGSPPVGTAPLDGRLALAGIIGARAQCLAGGAISTSASSMSVTVGQSVWSIPDPINSSAVFASPTDPATIAPSAGPASGSRFDSIYVIQHDYENGDADSRAVIGLTPGTAASSPSAPSIPSGAQLIATLTVPTGAANSAACLVTPYTVATTLAPLPIVAASFASLQQVTGQPGQRASVGNLEYRWSSGSWTLVPLLTMRCALQLNGARSTGPNGGDLQWDTVLSDPYNMRAGDSTSITALWTGRYAVSSRIAVQGDISNTEKVDLDVIDSGSGTVYGTVGQWGLPGDLPMQYTDELTLSAGTSIRFRIGWTGSSGARQFTYGNDTVRARISMRYLGPA